MGNKQLRFEPMAGFAAHKKRSVAGKARDGG